MVKRVIRIVMIRRGRGSAMGEPLFGVGQAVALADLGWGKIVGIQQDIRSGAYSYLVVDRKDISKLDDAACGDRLGEWRTESALLRHNPSVKKPAAGGVIGPRPADDDSVMAVLCRGMCCLVGRSSRLAAAPMLSRRSKARRRVRRWPRCRKRSTKNTKRSTR